MQKIFNKIKSFPYLAVLKSYFKTNLFMWILFIFLAVFFFNFPEIDIVVSSLFFTDTEGFVLRGKLLSNITYYTVNNLALTLIIVFAAYIMMTFLMSKRFLKITRKAVIFLLLAMALGPGLVVNEVLKDNIGRARPDVVTQFGGNHKFTAPFMPSNECQNNCSFVSGHASFGFYMMAFGFLATGMRRKILFVGGFLCGSLVGLMRITDGRHFFTDVLFSFFFVYLTIALLYEFMYYVGNRNKAIVGD